MTLTDFLSRLQNIKDVGGGKYTARCPNPDHEDKHNSFCVAQGNKGIVCYCQAGCDKNGCLAGMGLSMKDLFDENKSPPTGASGKREIEKISDYVDANGKLLFQSIRYRGKGFSQRRSDPAKPGYWIYNLQGVTPVIYNLPAVLAAVKDNKPVYVVEGEKDADALIAKGLVATCNPMGAGKWRDSYSEVLTDAYVYILPDNDTPGKNHAQAVAKSLHGKAKGIKICDLTKELPSLPEKGDVSDFLAMIPTDEQKSRFEQVVKNAVKYTGEPSPAPQQTTGGTSTLETISAQELAAAELPPLLEIVKGFLVQGLSLLCAPSKYGKSWLALALCLFVAMGMPFLTFPTVKSGVLYLALEDGHRRLKKRMRQILGDTPPPEGFDLATKAQTVDGGLCGQITDYLKRKPGTGLIVVDVLQRVRSSGGRNSNAYALDYSDMTALKDLADAHNICILVLHHVRKMPDKADVYNTISGTGGLMGCADTIYIIHKKSREDKEATLSYVGRDIEGGDYIMEFSGITYQWQIVGTAEEQRAQHVRKAYENDSVVKTIKGLFEEHPAGFSMTAGQFVEEIPAYADDYLTATKAGIAFKKLAPQLLTYDRIVYAPGDSKTRKHSFRRQGMSAEVPTAIQDNVITLFDGGDSHG